MVIDAGHQLALAAVPIRLAVGGASVVAGTGTPSTVGHRPVQPRLRMRTTTRPPGLPRRRRRQCPSRRPAVRTAVAGPGRRPTPGTQATTSTSSNSGTPIHIRAQNAGQTFEPGPCRRPPDDPGNQRHTHHGDRGIGAGARAGWFAVEGDLHAVLAAAASAGLEPTHPAHVDAHRHESLPCARHSPSEPKQGLW